MRPLRMQKSQKKMNVVNIITNAADKCKMYLTQ